MGVDQHVGHVVHGDVLRLFPDSVVLVCIVSGECGWVETIDSRDKYNKWRSVTVTDSPPWRQLYRSGRTAGKTVKPYIFFLWHDEGVCSRASGMQLQFLRHQQRAGLPSRPLKMALSSFRSSCSSSDWRTVTGGLQDNQTTTLSFFIFSPHSCLKKIQLLHF